jgi:hypothetical protein
MRSVPCFPFFLIGWFVVCKRSKPLRSVKPTMISSSNDDQSALHLLSTPEMITLGSHFYRTRHRATLICFPSSSAPFVAPSPRLLSPSARWLTPVALPSCICPALPYLPCLPYLPPSSPPGRIVYLPPSALPRPVLLSRVLRRAPPMIATTSMKLSMIRHLSKP